MKKLIWPQESVIMTKKYNNENNVKVNKRKEKEVEINKFIN